MKKELIFNIGFALINLVIMVVVVSLARGYTFNPITSSVERYGTLIIDSEPQGATVILNNESVGVTPIQKTLTKPGNYSVQLEKTGYRTMISDIIVDKNIVTKKYYKLINNDKQINSIFASNIKAQHFTQNANYLVFLETSNNENSLYYIDLTTGPLDQILGNSNYKPTLIGKINNLEGNVNITTSFDEKSGLIKTDDNKTIYHFNIKENSNIIDIKSLIKFTPTDIYAFNNDKLAIRHENKIYYFDTNENKLVLKYELDGDETFKMLTLPTIVKKSSLLFLDSTDELSKGNVFNIDEDVNLNEINTLFNIDNYNNLLVYLPSKNLVYLIKENNNKVNKIVLSDPLILYDKFINAREDLLISSSNNSILKINPVTLTTSYIQLEKENNLFKKEVIFSKTKDFGIVVESGQAPKFIDLNFKLVSIPINSPYLFPDILSFGLTQNDSLILVSLNKVTGLSEITVVLL